MPTEEIIWEYVLISGLTYAAVFGLCFYGWEPFKAWFRREEQRYEQVLVHDLLLNVQPRQVLALEGVGMMVVGALFYLAGDGLIFFIIGAGLTYFVPNMIVSHLEEKRRVRLDEQLVDGITTLSSGVRAGLNLVQAMELLVTNTAGPIKQEFSQLLHEYNMGLDLNQAMRNSANRIGLQNYRLLFTAIEMHRLRGGDTGESLDRIAESIREIQRLEGKLDAITAQGRAQARMMAAMPIVIVLIYWGIDPEGVNMLMTEPLGRIVLLIAVGMIVFAFFWIKRIMAVDI